MTEESRNGKGHIDLDKYKGHEYERMHIERWHLPDTPEEVMIANARLMDDAPLILLEVKRLRKVINKLLGAIHWDAFAEDDTTLEIGREVAELIKKTQ